MFQSLSREKLFCNAPTTMFGQIAITFQSLSREKLFCNFLMGKPCSKMSLLFQSLSREKLFCNPASGNTIKRFQGLTFNRSVAKSSSATLARWLTTSQNSAMLSIAQSRKALLQLLRSLMSTTRISTLSIAQSRKALLQPFKIASPFFSQSLSIAHSRKALLQLGASRRRDDQQSQPLSIAQSRKALLQRFCITGKKPRRMSFNRSFAKSSSATAAISTIWSCWS